MPAPGHHEKAIESVGCAVLTISDTRTNETDASGRLLCELLETAGHHVCDYRILKDEARIIRSALCGLRDHSECTAVILTGGTGLAPRDVTYEVVTALLDKKLDGFGEMFRARSVADIGSSAMLSRTVAGVMASTAVFSLPGSPAAVRLAMNELILPEIGHIAFLISEPQKPR